MKKKEGGGSAFRKKTMIGTFNTSKAYIVKSRSLRATAKMFLTPVYEIWGLKGKFYSSQLIECLVSSGEEEEEEEEEEKQKKKKKKRADVTTTTTTTTAKELRRKSERKGKKTVRFAEYLASRRGSRDSGAGTTETETEQEKEEEEEKTAKRRPRRDIQKPSRYRE
jgi:hypothetical protein